MCRNADQGRQVWTGRQLLWVGRDDEHSSFLGFGPDAKDKVKPVAPGNIWMWEAKRGWYVWRVLHDLLFYLISN